MMDVLKRIVSRWVSKKPKGTASDGIANGAESTSLTGVTIVEFARLVY